MTAAVITEAATGRVPDYLAKLEEREGPLVDLDPAGQELRDALRGDLHSHSDWSDGGSPIEEMAVTAIELGHEYLALTDHSPRLTVANGLTAERLAQPAGDPALAGAPAGTVPAAERHRGGHPRRRQPGPDG